MPSGVYDQVSFCSVQEKQPGISRFQKNMASLYADAPPWRMTGAKLSNAEWLMLRSNAKLAIIHGRLENECTTLCVFYKLWCIAVLLMSKE